MPIMRKLIRKQGAATMLVLAGVAANTMLGGSGVSYPLVELALQLILAAIAVAWVWRVSPDVLRAIPRSVWLIVVMVLAVPTLQLVPLPPAIWQHLPGREVELRNLTLLGLGDSWRPLSLMPDITLGSLISMASAMILLVMAVCVPRSGRTLLFGVIAAVALLSLVVGAGQIGGGDGNIFRIYQPDSAFLNGFQNARNAQADVLLIGMLCLAGVIRDMVLGEVLPDRRLLVLGGLAAGSAVLALGVVLTGSRTGMGLLIPVLVMQAILVRPWLGLGWRNLVLGAIALVVLAVLAFYALRENAMIGRALSRFATKGEFRPEIWTDTLFAIRSYLPWGAGMGTFIPVFFLHERLEIVSELVANRAHDDYLELVLEAGLPGILVAILVCSLIFSGLRKGITQGGRRVRGQVFCATSVLLVITLHSLVDYPLRSMSLAGIAAVCAAVLLNPLGLGYKQDD